MTDLPGNGYKLVETLLQEKTGPDRTRCHLCPWRCQIHHGQRGFCQAHVNRNGTLYNLSYGIVSSIAVTTIEEKPVRHYRPGSELLNVGSFGCSFRCRGCHNLEISWGTDALDTLARGESREAYVTPEQLINAALEKGVDGIAFTYSEPAVWLEYVLDVSKLAREAGLFTVYVSNSFVTPEALEVMAPWVDVLCSDIKSMQDAFYSSLCGAASVEQVLGSVKQSQALGMHVETRTNVIPGKNDSDDEFRAIASWIRDNLGAASPWHITRFFPAYQLSDVPATPPATLYRAADIAAEAGLENVYVYADKGCDCATENLSVGEFLAADVDDVKKCSASCCGDEGILTTKLEREAGLLK